MTQGESYALLVRTFIHTSGQRAWAGGVINSAFGQAQGEAGRWGGGGEQERGETQQTRRIGGNFLSLTSFLSAS